MWKNITYQFQDSTAYILSLRYSREQWIGLSVVVLLVGLLVLRGFGSRNRY